MHTAVGDLPTNAVRALQAELLPCLVFEGGIRDGVVIPVEDRSITAGRSLMNDLVLEGETVSRKHCALTGRGTSLHIMDLGSTNGTHVNDRLTAGTRALQIGDLVRVGEHTLRFMLRSRADVRSSDAKNADLERAARYVSSLLPPRIERGPVVADWEFMPSMSLGGDLFSYRNYDKGMLIFLLGISGTGVGAAMHATAIHSVLAQGSIPGVDMRNPTQVLEFLNQRFQMEHHQGLCCRLWYGHYDMVSRRLTYATGGHPPALMVSPDRKHIVPLETGSPIIGALPSQEYVSEVIDIPPSWSLYLFSDGACKLASPEGTDHGLQELEAMIRIKGPVGPGEPGRILRNLRASMSGGQEDDCTIMTMTFV